MQGYKLKVTHYIKFHNHAKMKLNLHVVKNYLKFIDHKNTLWYCYDIKPNN